MIQSLKTIKKVERSPFETLKMATAFGLGVAVDAAVTMALKSLIPNVRGWKGMLAKVGVFVLSMMAGEKAEEYVYVVIDETKEMFGEVNRELLEATEDAKEGAGEDGRGE
jgi:hypothetical protein